MYVMMRLPSLSSVFQSGNPFLLWNQQSRHVREKEELRTSTSTQKGPLLFGVCRPKVGTPKAMDYLERLLRSTEWKNEQAKNRVCRNGSNIRVRKDNLKIV